MDSTTPNKFTTSQRARGMPQIRSGHLLNCILSTFTIKDLCKKVRFEQTRNSGLRKLLLIVSWDLRTGCPFIYVVWEATHKARFKALEGHCVSSKSPSNVQNSDEVVAGREEREKYFLDEGSLIHPPGKSMIFYKRKKLSWWPDLLWPSLRQTVLVWNRVRVGSGGGGP